MSNTYGDLQDAIKIALEDIEKRAKAMTQVVIIESTAVVLNSDNDKQEQPKALPTPIVCHKTAWKRITWSEEKREAFGEMIKAAYAMVEGEQSS